MTESKSSTDYDRLVGVINQRIDTWLAGTTRTPMKVSLLWATPATLDTLLVRAAAGHGKPTYDGTRKILMLSA